MSKIITLDAPPEKQANDFVTQREMMELQVQAYGPLASLLKDVADRLETVEAQLRELRGVNRAVMDPQGDSGDID